MLGNSEGIFAHHYSKMLSYAVRLLQVCVVEQAVSNVPPEALPVTVTRHAEFHNNSSERKGCGVTPSSISSSLPLGFLPTVSW